MIKVYEEGASEGTIEKPKEPQIIVLFGAGGDLTKRLLMPAIYNLCAHEALPDKFSIIGLSREPLDNNSFRAKVAKDLQEFAKRQFDETLYQKMSSEFCYYGGDFDNKATYEGLKKMIGEIDQKFGGNSVITYYFAISPAIFAMVSNHLGEAGLAKMDGKLTRVIVEKPFGRDLKSALDLNNALHKYWDESQIWRIDHYLGKETVQNLLAFRFGNGIFEPIWNRNYIQHIQLTVAESVGVEKRGDYYDKSGALRDMFQNHIMQILSYLCMEAPSSFEAETIRNCKVEVLKSITPMKDEEVKRHVVRGQYDAGEVAGIATQPYRNEPDVNKNSNTETFAAIRLFIDNWRWSGVPIYIRTGKHLKEKVAKVIVHFKRAPKKLFNIVETEEVHSNELRFYLQPKQAIVMILKAKIPGTRMALKPVKMFFDFHEGFESKDGNVTTGYETLIYDAMRNDPTLFSRADLIEQAWRITQPILNHWQNESPQDFPNYKAGTWGPEDANKLILEDGHHWRN